MISSLWPQMFNFQPSFYWLPTVSYIGSFEPNLVEQCQIPVLEQLPSTSKLNDRNIEEHLKEPRRRTWTVEEDQKLLAVIKAMNFSETKRLPYHKIAKYFQGRTSKQIRERYLNHLNSSINKDPFTKEQDTSILEYYTENGPKWKKLSMILIGRTPTALKNRFNTKLKQTLTKYSVSNQQSEQLLKTSSKFFQTNLPSNTENYSSQESF